MTATIKEADILRFANKHDWTHNIAVTTPDSWTHTFTVNAVTITISTETTNEPKQLSAELLGHRIPINTKQHYSRIYTTATDHPHITLKFFDKDVLWTRAMFNDTHRNPPDPDAIAGLLEHTTCEIAFAASPTLTTLDDLLPALTGITEATAIYTNQHRS